MSREALVEAGGAFAALAVAVAIALVPAGGGVLAAVSLMIVVGWIVWRDVRDLIIPDGASVALLVLALGARLAVEGVTLNAALFALGEGLACGAALWAVREGFYRLRGHDGLGFGDVKLAVGAGVLTGLSGFAVALLAASLAGLAIAVLRRGGGESEKLPLGALLAPAALGVWALGFDGLTS